MPGGTQWLRRDQGRRFRDNALSGTQKCKGSRLRLEPSCLVSQMPLGWKVWRQVLHVRLPEPERTAFQFSWPWRKQIMSDRKQLLLTWQAETLPHGATWSPHECRWKVRSDETFGGRGM